MNDHLVEPHDLWTARLSRSRREAGPRLHVEGSNERWVFGSESLSVAALSVLAADGAGRATTIAGMHPAVNDPTARLAAMDLDGVQVQTLMPHVCGFAGERLRQLGDAALWAAAVRTYNDYLLTEFCATAPQRLIGVALLPLADPEAAAAELRRCARLGARAVAFPHDLAALGLPTLYGDDWSPLFRAAVDEGMPLFVHVGSSGAPPSIFGQRSPGALLTLGGLDVAASICEWIFSGALVRYGPIQLALLEGGAAWWPYIVERVKFFVRQRPEVWTSSVTPARVFDALDQVWLSFIEDRSAMDSLRSIGATRLMWQSDFPHADSPWPHSRASVNATLEGLPEADRAAVASSNARKLLRL